MNKPIYVVVTPFFPSPTNWRGAYCYDFVKALMRTGKYDVRVFVPGSDGGYEYQGVKVTTFKTWALPSAIFPFLFARRNKKSFLDALRREGVKPEEVSICHGHTSTFGIYPLAVKRKNPKCLSMLHHHSPTSFGMNLGIFRTFWPYNVIEYPILRRQHEQIDLHVFISEMVKQSFLRVPDTSWSVYGLYRKQFRGLGFYRGVKMKRGVILHNGVDTERFYPDGVCRGENRPFTIGCIGNFIDWKDQITLLKAVKLLLARNMGPLRVRMVGSGPYLAACKEHVRANGIMEIVSFEKECDHTQLPDFYRALDLFVLPSYFEGFGCVFTEAWACGVPFITCQGQGMDDLIPEDEKPKWLCRPMDAQDLADKIYGYYRNRYCQKMTEPVSIDYLVGKFVNDL